MAINLKEFKATKYPNLYKSIAKDKINGYKYLLWGKIDGILYKKILGYSDRAFKNYIRLDTDKKANEYLLQLITDITNGYTSNEKAKLQDLFLDYFSTLDKTKQWTIKKEYIYNHYIKDFKINSKLSLSSMKVNNIQERHIKQLLNSLSEKGLSPRTQKSILEVLNPLFRFAAKNKYIKSEDNPVADVTVKIPNQKKIVTGATKLFNQVFQGITSLYKDEPFYQALFLFGFTGRRKTEILTLKWENIDFKNNYYWIEDTKNDDKQKYQLPPFIKKQLLKINDTRFGLVFKSPVTGKKISNIDRQFRNLIKHLALMYCDDNPLYQAYTILKAKEKTKEYIYNLKWSDTLTKDLKEILEPYNGDKTGLIFKDLHLEKFDKLSPHYMRNILVSMLAEQGTEAITLSGLLGHKDVNTINKYLSINYYKSSQEGYKKIDEIIDIEVIE